MSELKEQIVRAFYSGVSVTFDVQDDSSILHEVRRSSNGKIIGEFRFMTSVIIEGKSYDANTCYFVELSERLEGH